MIPIHTSIILDTRRRLKDGTYPVKLRITFLRQRKYFHATYNNVNCSLTEQDFKKTQGEQPRGEYKKMQIAFQAIEQKAIHLIGELNTFSFEEFEKKFLNLSIKNDMFSAFDLKIQELLKEGRIGTAKSYENASFSLLSYIQNEPKTHYKGLTKVKALAKRQGLLNKRKSLSYSTVTVDFLKDYEKWMLNRGNSISTVGFYLRAVRAMYNNAIESGEAKIELYPFGKRKYQIPAGRNIKKALKLSDIEKIYNYQATTQSEAKAKDYWLFSYLASGINIKDLARLKYRNIDAERITFIRAKTERANRQKTKSIVVMLEPEIKQIVERWGNKPALADTYVFPILKDGLTPQQEAAAVKQAIKTINMYIKRIAAAVGIEKEVTTYTARHSFATILRNEGTPTEIISESLGHSNLMTTESYLDSFEDNMKRQYTAKLTAFSKQETSK